MSFLNDSVRNNGLSVLTGSRVLHICSSLPTTFSQATTTLTLGSAAITIPATSAATPTGRQITVPAISSGNVTAPGSATAYAIVDAGTSSLLVAGALSNSLVVANGNTFTTNSFNIVIP